MAEQEPNFRSHFGDADHFKLVVLPVIIRHHPVHGVQIHAQKRHVIDKQYDPLYDGTWETCGETFHPNESIVDAVLRGCREEMGDDTLVPLKIIGAEGCEVSLHSTRAEDSVLEVSPLLCVQQLKGPQPWLGLAFVVEVAEDFEPKLDKEGENSAHAWWSPQDLLFELENHKSKFMGFHYPALLHIARLYAK